MAVQDPLPMPPEPTQTLQERLESLKRLELEFQRKCQASLGADINLSHSDFFVLGAVRRVLAQSSGFRLLISSRNFPCAAAILRLQIDTAMRMNGLTLVSDMNQTCQEVLDGAAFNKQKTRDGKTKLSDAVLRIELEKSEPWIKDIYKQTSDFVHLSGRHFYNSIASTEESSRTVTFVFGGEDPPRPEHVYFEIVDAFQRSTKLVAMMIVAYLQARSFNRGI